MKGLHEFLESDRFIVLGGHKCGTSSLHTYLAQHPEITMPITKGEDLLASVNLNLENYANSYDLTNPKKILGEVSSVYLHKKRAMPRLQKHFPNAKFVIILRNPIERMVSHYYHMQKDDLPFTQNFKLEEICLHPEQYLEQGVIENGLYSQHLEPYLESFGLEKFLILLFDDFVNNKSAFYKSLFKFIGVDSNFMPDTSIILRKGQVKKENALKKFLYSPSVKKTIGKILKPFTNPEQRRALFYRVDNQLQEKYQPLSSNNMQNLLEFYRKDILKTESLTQKDLSLWLKI
ncbi:MAG: sulfotransferase [Microcystaceae cyanobacterium]